MICLPYRGGSAPRCSTPPTSPLGKRAGCRAFAALDQPDSYSVENQTVTAIAAVAMAVDRFDGGRNVIESLTVPTTHNATASRSTAAATDGLRSPARTSFTRAARSCSRTA